MSNLISTKAMAKPYKTFGKAKVMGVAFVVGVMPTLSIAAPLEDIQKGIDVVGSGAGFIDPQAAKVLRNASVATGLVAGGKAQVLKAGTGAIIEKVPEATDVLKGAEALKGLAGVKSPAGALSAAGSLVGGDLSKVLGAFGGLEGLMKDPDIKKLITSVGKEAACAMLGKAAEGMGQAGSLVGALCNLPSLPKIDPTNVPLTGVGMIADAGPMMNGMMQQMAQQLISKIMEKLQGGGGGDEGGGGGGLENAGGGTGTAAPLTSLAGLKVIQATSAQEQYLNTKNTGHSSKSGYAVVNVPQAAIQGQYSAKSPYTAGTQVALRIGNYQTVGTSLGGIRMPDGSAAVQVGVRLGAFAEAGVQVANNGTLSFDPAQATSVAGQVNPVIDLYNVGYEDAVNGRSPNTVFVGASAYDQGYTLGLQARQTAFTIG